MKNIFTCLFLCICTCMNISKALSEPGSGENAAYQKITAEEAKKMMDSGKPYILLDVRTEEEYGAKRISGALLIPYSAISERAMIELPDKSALILIYCHGGGRSANTAIQLIRMGYVNVYDFGGIRDWTFGTVSGR